MPELTDVQQPPIYGPQFGPGPYSQPHIRTPLGTPTPLSPKEQTYVGHVFAIDTPYFGTPLGWGEWDAVLPSELGEVPPEDVVELAAPVDGPVH